MCDPGQSRACTFSRSGAIGRADISDPEPADLRIAADGLPSRSADSRFKAEPTEAAVTIETAPLSTCPSVFDAGLPWVDYLQEHDPFEAHRIISAARQQAPIAMGPYAPEVLSYELVRTVLRDPRFVTAPGLGLDLQGITSGPLWDRAITSILSLDGDAHSTLVVFTHDAADACPGIGSTAEAVRALRIDRKTGAESLLDLAPA